MFAFFNIGLQEMIILAVLAVAGAGTTVAVVVTVVSLTRKNEPKE